MGIQTEISKGLMTITINRPERKNAFTNAMYTTLADAFCDAIHNCGVKAVLLKGHESCFSAGNDLGDFQGKPPSGLDSPVFRFLRTIAMFPKPVVAQVQGLAVGIGTTLLLHCDLVYAASNAKFSMPFVKLGLCPEAGSSLLLPMSAGYQKAAELLLLGDMFTALKAYDCGIVSDVLEPEHLQAHVQAQVKKLLDLPLGSLLASKRLMKSQSHLAVSQRMRDEAGYFTKLLAQPPAQEAFKAFVEKRAPDFAQFEPQFSKGPA